jgi:hypothetical protein
LPIKNLNRFKNGLEISQANRYSIHIEENVATFTVKQLYDTDNNQIVGCEISNPLGKDKCEAFIRVKGILLNYIHYITFIKRFGSNKINFWVKAIPKVESDPGDQFVNLGDALKIKVPIIGKGPFTLKLKKDDGTEEPSRIRVNEIDGTVILTIPG